MEQEHEGERLHDVPSTWYPFIKEQRTSLGALAQGGVRDAQRKPVTYQHSRAGHVGHGVVAVCSATQAMGVQGNHQSLPKHEFKHSTLQPRSNCSVAFWPWPACATLFPFLHDSTVTHEYLRRGDDVTHFGWWLVAHVKGVSLQLSSQLLPVCSLLMSPFSACCQARAVR